MGSAVLEVSSGRRVHVESRKREKVSVSGNTFHGGPGLPGPEEPSHPPQPSPAASPGRGRLVRALSPGGPLALTLKSTWR